MFWENRGDEADSKIFLINDRLRKTYADVFALADNLYSGVPRGTVVILCEKTSETIEAYVGALRNNLVPLLLDGDLRPEALERYLSLYKPALVFSNHEINLNDYVAFRTMGPAVLYVRVKAEPVALNPDLALLLPTSGSTGDPKCVRISHKNIQSCTDAVCEYLEIDSTRRAISLLPLHYSYGLSVLHTVMNGRASFVLSPISILDRDFWPMIEREGITDLSGVPFIFELMRRMRIPDGVLENLKCVTQAGGRLEPKFTQLFLDKFTDANIRYFTMYGQTEASPRISYLAPDIAREKHGSVGRPISCGQAHISETGDAVGQGELVYSGPNVCLGYAYNREDLALGDEFNGVLHTGDQVRIDEDGYIFIIGRRKRFIKLQGISVNLDHVESVLKDQNFNCMVIGTENKIRICYNGTDASELSALVGQNFSFHPSTIKYIEVGKFPLNSSGKPDYTLLTSEYL